MGDARQLLERLRQLTVSVDTVAVRCFDVPVRPYEDGARPSSEVKLSGGGLDGRGENVAWTRAAHRELAVLVEGIGPFRCALGELPGVPSPYANAAFEGAAIDLALRQAGLSLGDLVPGEPTTLRTMISFDRCPDPESRAAGILRANPTARFKVDLDPDWRDLTVVRRIPIEVLDFKGAGDAALERRMRALLPDALFEDPPGNTGPTGRDQPVLTAAGAAVAPGEHVNLKAPRMGGWLALIEGAAIASERGTSIYFGGMFELGVGRLQAQQLAGLLAPDAWHDLAPIPTAETDARRLSVATDPYLEGFRGVGGSTPVSGRHRA